MFNLNDKVVVNSNISKFSYAPDGLEGAKGVVKQVHEHITLEDGEYSEAVLVKFKGRNDLHMGQFEPSVYHSDKRDMWWVRPECLTLVKSGEDNLIQDIPASPAEPKVFTGHTKVVHDHLTKVKTISVREAMDDYGLSGGHITKIISNLRKAGVPVEKQMRKHPVTGRRYARYYLMDFPVPAKDLDVLAAA